MNAEFVRDAAGAATVFAFFASTWFGWAQENPPVAWKNLLIAVGAPLIVGALFSLLNVISWNCHWSHMANQPLYFMDQRVCSYKQIRNETV